MPKMPPLFGEIIVCHSIIINHLSVEARRAGTLIDGSISIKRFYLCGSPSLSQQSTSIAMRRLTNRFFYQKPALLDCPWLFLAGRLFMVFVRWQYFPSRTPAEFRTSNGTWSTLVDQPESITITWPRVSITVDYRGECDDLRFTVTPTRWLGSPDTNLGTIPLLPPGVIVLSDANELWNVYETTTLEPTSTTTALVCHTAKLWRWWVSTNVRAENCHSLWRIWCTVFCTAQVEPQSGCDWWKLWKSGKWSLWLVRTWSLRKFRTRCGQPALGDQRQNHRMVWHK